MNTLDNYFVLVGLLMISLFYTTQSSILCNDSCPSTTAFAVSVGVISAVVCGLNLFLTMMTDEAAKVNLFFAFFLAVWWTAGSGVGTFSGPYVDGNPLNGFVAAWAGLIVSYYNLYTVFDFFKEKMDKARNISGHGSLILILLVCSTFFMSQSAVLCSKGNCTSYEGYAITLGAIGILISFALMIFEKVRAENTLKGTAAFSILWWGIGVAVVTFHAPYTTLSNGYVTSWMCFVISVIFAALCAREDDDLFTKRYPAPTTGVTLIENNYSAPTPQSFGATPVPAYAAYPPPQQYYQPQYIQPQPMKV